MDRAHLSVDSIKLLQADLLDESLLAVAVDSTEKFVRVFRYSTEANNIDTAIQTEEAIDAEEGCSGASRPGGVPKQ